MDAIRVLRQNIFRSAQLQGKDWADNVTLSYNSNLIQAMAQRRTVQPNFNPEVGFVDRTDLVTNLLDLNLSPRPRSGPVREYNFEVDCSSSVPFPHTRVVDISNMNA